MAWLIKDKEKIIDRFTILDKQTIIVGRSPNVDVTINNISVSRRHASFARQGNRVVLTDLDSRNGTRVNGKTITQPVPIHPTDTIKIGKFTLVPPQSKDEGAGFAAIRLKEDRLRSLGATQQMDETYYVDPKSQKKISGKLTRIKGSVAPKELVLSGKTDYGIGKNPDSDMRIRGLFVGHVQCTVQNRHDLWFLKPQPDSKPPSLNDKIVTGLTELSPGDIIGIGGVQIKFE
jgi:predicted component of type VI protein secretion system